MLTACWRKSGLFAQNLFEKASFLEIVYALLNYISRWSGLCFFSWQLLSQVFVFTLILLLPWSPQLDGNGSSSHKRCCPSWGLPGPLYSFSVTSVRDWSWGQVVFHRVCWRRCCPMVIQGHIYDCPIFTVLNRCVFSLLCLLLSLSWKTWSACSSCQFCVCVSCVVHETISSVWGTWWFFHLGMSSVCSDATDC